MCTRDDEHHCIFPVEVSAGIPCEADPEYFIGVDMGRYQQTCPQNRDGDISESWFLDCGYARAMRRRFKLKHREYGRKACRGSRGATGRDQTLMEYASHPTSGRIVDTVNRYPVP